MYLTICHGALRSIIKEEKQFIFEEKIADTFCLETINIGREEKEKYFKKLRYNNQTRLRDLENWPLFDVKNICIDTCENFLLVDIEMIIVDGMSLQLILKDFWDIYSNTMRVSHGREINAACGQLANTYNKFKKK